MHKTIEVDADKANASALTGGSNSSAFPVKFSDLSDPKAKRAPGTASPPAPAVDAAPNNSASSNSITASTQTMSTVSYVIWPTRFVVF